jgi:hypothetical protein
MSAKQELNNLTFPGFTAEASLIKNNDGHRVTYDSNKTIISSRVDPAFNGRRSGGLLEPKPIPPIQCPQWMVPIYVCRDKEECSEETVSCWKRDPLGWHKGSCTKTVCTSEPWNPIKEQCTWVCGLQAI